VKDSGCAIYFGLLLLAVNLVTAASIVGSGLRGVASAIREQPARCACECAP
jgi:hypothetical protein